MILGRNELEPVSKELSCNWVTWCVCRSALQKYPTKPHHLSTHELSYLTSDSLWFSLTKNRKKSLHRLSQILQFPVFFPVLFAETLDIRFIIRHDHGYPLHYASRTWISASLYVTTVDIGFIIRHDHGYPLHYASRTWISASLYVTTMDIRFIIRHNRGHRLHYTSRPWISASLYVTNVDIRFIIRHDHLLTIFASFAEKLCD